MLDREAETKRALKRWVRAKVSLSQASRWRLSYFPCQEIQAQCPSILLSLTYLNLPLGVEAPWCRCIPRNTQLLSEKNNYTSHVPHIFCDWKSISPQVFPAQQTDIILCSLLPTRPPQNGPLNQDRQSPGYPLSLSLARTHACTHGTGHSALCVLLRSHRRFPQFGDSFIPQSWNWHS